MTVISSSPNPLEVIAAVQILNPDGSIGERGSKGIIFLLIESPISSSAFSPAFPVTQVSAQFFFVTSSSIR